LNVSFGQNFTQGFLRGFGSDIRMYNRELSANEVLSLYETAGIDFQLKLNIEETKKYFSQKIYTK
jgi:hypothetical protein